MATRLNNFETSRLEETALTTFKIQLLFDKNITISNLNNKILCLHHYPPRLFTAYSLRQASRCKIIFGLDSKRSYLFESKPRRG
jgi:hypothetical protein